MPDTTMNDELADGLLRGQMTAEAVPADYRAVAGLLGAVRGPAVESELASEAAVVGAAVAAIRSTLPVTPLHDPGRAARRRRVPGRLTAAAAAGVVILGGSAAAAATDSLPGPAQTAVSDALSPLGISVPKPNSHANKHASDNPGHSGTAPGRSGTAPGHQGGHGSGPAVQSGAPDQFGLCTAFLAGQGGTSGNRNSSTAFAKLIAAHGGSVATTTTYCKGVVANHPGGGGSEGTDDQQGGTPSGSGRPSSGAQAPGGGAPAQSGKPSTVGPPAGAGNSSSPGANGSGGGNGAGHAPAPATTPTSTSVSTSSTINGHSKAGSAHA